MKKQELIKHIEDLPYKEGSIVDKIYISRKGLLELVKQLDEPQKVTIPQFVANWIANVKRNGFKFRNSSRFYEEIVSSDDAYRVMYYILKEGIAGEAIRIWVNANRDTFAHAWLDGYKLEEEKRYRVKMKGILKANEVLNYKINEEKWVISSGVESTFYRTKHTRKELEEAGFGWVFDSPGFQIEEVE